MLRLLSVPDKVEEISPTWWLFVCVSGKCLCFPPLTGSSLAVLLQHKHCLWLEFIMWDLKCIKWNVPVCFKQTYVYGLQINLIKYICRNLWYSAPSTRYAISILASKEFSISVLTFPHRRCGWGFFKFFYFIFNLQSLIFVLLWNSLRDKSCGDLGLWLNFPTSSFDWSQWNIP